MAGSSSSVAPVDDDDIDLDMDIGDPSSVASPPAEVVEAFLLEMDAKYGADTTLPMKERVAAALREMDEEDVKDPDAEDEP